ncbi:App1 family protein [Halocola ammonii]
MLKPLTEKVSLFLKQKLGMLGKPVILPFRGFGNENKIVVRGRVMEDRGLAQPRVEANVWRNMGAMLRRYISDNIPAVRVEIQIGEECIEVTTDDNGIFNLEIELSKPLNSAEDWVPYSVKLLDELIENQGEISAEGEVLIPKSNPEFGVISDVDDTFMVSYSAKLRKKMRLMLTKNAHTRMPFEGVSEFYHGLCKSGKNPIFFVSSSEWNLYDLLVDFCKFHNIPKGPFLLKPLKASLIKLLKSGGGQHDHKLEKIRSILETYPDMNFVLIGDSGQHDPELYSQITLEFPARIISIYIRDVTKKKRDREVRKLAENLDHPTTEMLLVKDSADAMEDARKKGLISQ